MKKFLFFLTIFYMSAIFSAQVAVVSKSKAVIYSDIDLKSPIGFVRKGKRLAVGEIKRRRGEILPVVVNGRVAWIKVQDINLPEDAKAFDKNRKITEHEVLIDSNAKDPLGLNNYMTLRTGPSSLEITSTSDGVGESTSEIPSATETSLMFDHKNPYRMFHWGFGLEYFQGEISFLQFKSLNLKGGFSWVPIRLSLLSVEAYANILLSGDFRVRSRNIGEYKGNMFGADYGVMVRLFPESLFGLVAGFGLTEYRFSGLNSIQNDSFDFLTEVKSFRGSKVFAGFSYRFK
jgi:hypothetical protein